ncbi:MAG: hypothetical protein ACRDS0_09355 [Pseudonocardiaceae bacterium]
MTASTTECVDTRDMIAVHTAFRREFRLAPGLVRGTAVGDASRASIVGAHLGAEEQHILPLAARSLSAAEWQQLGEEGFAALPKNQLSMAFGAIMYQGSPEVISSMLTHAPVLPRLLMPMLGPRAYARYARRVHGTTKP